MGRSPCCVKEGLNRGAWTAMEDKILTDFIQIHGEGKWRNLPKKAGLKRCGKSCRLRWLNYLRPGIKRGNITHEEEDLIIRLHNLLGNRWSLIAGRLPGRTDNEIKNYWNTTIGKKLQSPNSSTSSTHHQFNQPNATKRNSLSTLNAQPTKVFWTKASKCSKMVIPNNNTIPQTLSPSSNSVSRKICFGSEENYNNSSDLFLDIELEESLLFDLLDEENFSQLNNCNDPNSEKNVMISDEGNQDWEFFFMDSLESGEFNWIEDHEVL